MKFYILVGPFKPELSLSFTFMLIKTNKNWIWYGLEFNDDADAAADDDDKLRRWWWLL